MRITDKQMLDWVNKKQAQVIGCAGGFDVYANGNIEPLGSGVSVREALDASIRADRRGRDARL